MRGAVLGVALGSAPGASFAVWATWQNPWFLDEPGWFVGVAVLPFALVLGLVGALVDRAQARLAWLALLPSALGLLSAVLWPTPSPPAVELLVIGMDGATFTQMDPMIRRGELRNLAALQRDGARATLRSMDPMFSPQLWTTLATGQPPAVHGVRGFNSRYDRPGPPRFWDLAAAQGKTVGLYRWLGTWPPPSGFEFVVPGWMAQDGQTVPAELEGGRLERSEDSVGVEWLSFALAGVPVGVRAGTLRGAAQAGAMHHGAQQDVARRMLDAQVDRDVFVHALHRYGPQVATFSLYTTDAVAHRHWGGEELEQTYVQADALLGDLLAQLGPGCTVVLVSDHGFRGPAPAEATLAIRPLTRRLELRLSELVGPVEVVRLGAELNVSPARDDLQMQVLEQAIAGLTDELGAPMYRVRVSADDPRSLQLALTDPAVQPARLSTGAVGGEPMTDYLRPEPPLPGVHDSAGVFLARGPKVPAGAELTEMGLLDLAPTVLDLLELRVPEALPGRAVFAREAPLE